MEGSGLSRLDNNVEIRILDRLLDEFGSSFSLKQIASAYCKARRDVDLTGAMLYDLSNSASIHSPDSLPKNGKSSEASPKSSKSKNPHVAGESVSSKLDESYVRLVANESKDFHVPSEESSFNLAKYFGTRNDTVEFLFKMLGESFQLDRDMIRKVLGCCGYDMQKSMEALLDMPTVTSEKRNNYCGASSKISTDTCPDTASFSSAGGDSNLDSEANVSKLRRKQKGHNDVQHEVLSALFLVPQSHEEFHARTFEDNGVKKSKGFGHMTVEHLTDATVEYNTDKINPHNAIKEDDEGDSYLVLRKAVREHRATTKEYYKSAVEAFAKGDLALAGRLFEEGQFYQTKAREADEESVGIIFEPRNEETADAVTLDLHDHSAKEAISLLKCHLSSLSGIPSMKYLKVIVEMNDDDTSKRCRKRLIIKLLEKESIMWIEGEIPGTILILLDQINPKHLSFARK